MGGEGMERSFSWTRFAGHGFWAVTFFWTLAGFGVASAGPSSGTTLNSDPFTFPITLAVLMFFAMAAIEAWLFWKAWKNRDPEEQPQPEVLAQAPRPVTLARTAAPRKRASRERVKVPV